MDSTKMALDALTAALDAMEHMANTLNNMDAVDEDEDAQHDAAFEAVRAAIAALQAEPQPDAAFVRNLLWDEHPECCGCPVVGAIYMGEQEMVCCGQPEPALLNDRQIVASLRVKFPALPTPPKD